MRAKKIGGAEEYLAQFHKVLEKREILVSFPKINYFYQELENEFLKTFHHEYENLFVQWGKLLAIDAQLQILLEISNVKKSDLLEDLGMNEEEIIQMIRNDHKFFYREITGVKHNQKPKWGLIYLSEE